MVVAAAALAGVAFAAGFFWRDNQPEYQGKKLSQWLVAYEVGRMPRRGDPGMDKADDAIRRIGTSALPCLLRWVEYEPSAWKMRTEHFLGWFGADNLRWFHKRQILAIEASEAFKILGPEAVPAVPELARLAHTRRGGYAMRALAFTGQEGFPLLLQAAMDAPQAGMAVDLKSLVEEMQAAGNSTWLPQALGEAAQHTNRSVRLGAVRMLIEMGDKRCAVPALKPALADPDVEVRTAATNGILLMAPEVLWTNLAR